MPKAAPLLRQMRQLGIKARFLGGDGVCTTEMIKLTSKELDNNVVCTQGGVPMEKMPRWREVLRTLQGHASTPMYSSTRRIATTQARQS